MPTIKDRYAPIEGFYIENQLKVYMQNQLKAFI